MAAILHRPDLILSAALMLLTLYIPSTTALTCSRGYFCQPHGITDKAEEERIEHSTRSEEEEVTCDVCVFFVCIVDGKKNVMMGFDCPGNVGKICTDVDAVTLSSLKSDTNPMTYSVDHTHLFFGCNTEECMTAMADRKLMEFFNKTNENNMPDFKAKNKIFQDNLNSIENSTCEGRVINPTSSTTTPRTPIKVRRVPISKYSRKNSGIQVDDFKVLGMIMLGWMMMALLG